ncbi:MAG TPA: type II CAAX endopeptidase family protein, partial [Mycobacteriales bacterium]
MALTAIALSGLMMLISRHTGPDLHRTVLRAIEIGVALTVGTYLVVGAITAQVVRTAGVRLRWTSSTGRWPLGVLIGVASGGAIGAVLLLHTQAVTGHVVIDSGISLQLSEDTWWAVVLTMLTLVVAAPVVEETIFRGLLADSFLGSGLVAAIAVSAPAFWLWHWRPSVEAFLVLAGAGAIFAVVYRYHGLLGSMAAHATYNGILVAVAVTQLAGPGHYYQVGGLGLHAPQAWRTVSNSPDALVLMGPSAASFQVATRRLGRSPSIPELTKDLQDGARALRLVGQISTGPVTPVSLPSGDGVQLTITVGAHHATLIEFADGTQLYAIESDDEGSATAARQAREIVASLR